MARIRTFIALQLARPVQARLRELQENLARTTSNIKWVSAENLHLTLLFLGEVEQLEVVAICRAVKARAEHHEPFEMEIRGVGGFPNGRRPKILWAGIGAGSEPLKALHADLEAALLDLGCYRREDRAYTPHLTLGRLSAEDDDEVWGKLLAAQAGFDSGYSHVAEVLVMASEQRRDGYEYSIMGRGRLGTD